MQKVCGSILTLFAVAIAAPSLAEGAARSVTQLAVEDFIQLPADVRHPEGIASNPANGDIYVGTFDAREPAIERRNEVLRYSAQGKLLGRRSFGATPLTGLEFRDGRLYILNFGASKLQRLPADFDSTSKVEDVLSFARLTPAAPEPRTVPNADGSEDVIHFGAAGFPAPNGMVFDRQGNLFVSDSFQGAILRIADATRCSPCEARPISRDPLLLTTGLPPFGANGLAFSADERTLYITNAGDGRLLKMALPEGSVGVLAESLPGADGLLFHDGLLWVAANQSDTVFALTEQGRIVAKTSGFSGIAADGSPVGLLFPASTVVQGRWMIVTNLALPLTARQGDEWEEDITRWTLSRFRLPAASTSNGK